MPQVKYFCMFSKACQYGIRAVLYLAQHSTAENKIGVRAIAEAIDVPKHFLAKILQQLSKSGLISSSQGPKGGFFSSSENKKLSLKPIIQCIDGPDVFNRCILGLAKCSSTKPCPLHFQALAYREGMRFQLTQLSIEELSKKMQSY